MIDPSLFPLPEPRMLTGNDTPIISPEERMGLSRPGTHNSSDTELERIFSYGIVDAIGIKNGHKVSGRKPVPALAERLGIESDEGTELIRKVYGQLLQKRVLFVKNNSYPDKPRPELSLTSVGRSIYDDLQKTKTANIENWQ